MSCILESIHNVICITIYNGEQISNTSNSLITNGNSSLLTTVQEGVYEVRYEGLLVLPYDRTCESNLLKFLRGYAGFLPTRFLIKRQGK